MAFDTASRFGGDRQDWSLAAALSMGVGAGIGLATDSLSATLA